jgi:hypothetical protein
VLPDEPRVVRAAVCGAPSCDCLTGGGCECDLGSPVREICTPGSAWGDRSKVPCRLGEGTGSKEPAPARLRKGYRSEACPYQPYHPALSTHAVHRVRPGNHARWEEVARDLNRTVRGWAAYFSYGSSCPRFVRSSQRIP